jgi:hypothetical protein
MDARIDGLATGGLYGHQSIITNAAEDLDHLPIAIIAALQFASDRGHGRRQNPVLERGTVAQGAGFACQNRHIMPWVVDGLVPAKGAGMFTDHHAILPNDDPIGIGMNLDGPSDRDGWSIIEIPVERTENAVCDILSLGPDAVLLGPDPLIAAVMDVIGKLVVQYGKPA